MDLNKMLEVLENIEEIRLIIDEKEVKVFERDSKEREQ